MTSYSGQRMAKYYNETEVTKTFYGKESLFCIMKKDFLLEDNGKLSLYQVEHFINLRSSFLTLRYKNQYIIQSYSPHRFSGQLGYYQNLPGGRVPLNPLQESIVEKDKREALIKLRIKSQVATTPFKEKVTSTFTKKDSFIEASDESNPSNHDIPIQVATTPNQLELGFNDVNYDDGPCALPLDSMSYILGPTSYDLPLITSKDLDGNPPLKEFSTSHYEGKQQDAHQTKKASCHVTSEMSAFCDNNFMTDYCCKVSVMAWKVLRAKIGRTSTSYVPSLAEQAHIIFDEDELIKMEEELARMTSRKKILKSTLEGMKSDVLEKQSMVSKVHKKISKVEAMPIHNAEDE
ncbi:hypothetical protein JCGZ_07888 [Jatropha curcas]|uniref:Uncharacterized protein n=1 Tax=Jatropha curcas TaxID=180498 RepID=A0A067KWN0_JATCU|nr:hypothetical protein JCGZ_07888 [Jatropha curcas]